ncbi:MAG: hypothetical protein KF834_06220 [Burkholderiales bacterium]|nr:hypothetical protein [Burkholderiales bacterium]
MIELTGLGGLLSAIGLLYWVIAIGAVLLAIHMSKGTKSKVILPAIAVAVFGFLPAKEVIEEYLRYTYAKEAWAYFKKLCDEKSGEKIYKTYTGVKSVLIVKPLPRAEDKDHYNQFWYGDPYSAPAHSRRGVLEATNLASKTAPVSPGLHGRGFDFIEMRDESGSPIRKYYYGQIGRSYQSSINQSVESRFGIAWDDISTPEDRKFWVAGSRLRVIDLADNSVVAERVGYFIEAGFGSTSGQRRPWLTSRGPNTTCPSISNGFYEDRWFILKVLNPNMEKQGGE